MLLVSPNFPFPHGFTTREGGVSEGPLRSLNLGFSVGDDRARVEENFRRLAHRAGIPPGAFATASQVHGDRVVEISIAADGEAPPPPCGEADALWTGVAGVAVGVKTADCVPILIADPASGRAAAVHSGWRGTDARIAARAVEAFAARGSDPSRLVAAVGPAIGACCYEVSEELAERFARGFGDEVVSRARPRPHLDLPRAVALTLEQAGIPRGRIDLLAVCTSCDRDRFFSHRRDRGVTGRHLSFAVAGRPR